MASYPAVGGRFLKGMIASLVIVACFAVARATGSVEISPELILGRLVVREESTLAFWVGFAWFLVNGGLISLIYAEVFKKAGRSGPGFGAALGTGHAILALYAYETLWLLPSYLPGIGPGLRLNLEDRHALFSLGMRTAGWILVSHILYGVALGFLDLAFGVRAPETRS